MKQKACWEASSQCNPLLSDQLALKGPKTIPIKEFNDTLGKVIFLGWCGVGVRSWRSSVLLEETWLANKYMYNYVLSLPCKQCNKRSLPIHALEKVVLFWLDQLDRFWRPCYPYMQHCIVQDSLCGLKKWVVVWVFHHWFMLPHQKKMYWRPDGCYAD